MLRITVHDHPRDPHVPARRELGRAVVAGAGGVLAGHPGPPEQTHAPRRLDGGDLHRCRGPGLPCGHAPPRGRIHRPRLPDESRRGRDHPDNRSRPRASEVTGSSRNRPTERGNINMGSNVHENSGPAIEARPTPAGAAPAGDAGWLTSATSRRSRPSGPPKPRTRQPIPLLPRRPLRPGRRRTGGEDGCCGRGPWPAWRSRDISWSPTVRDDAEHGLHR